MSSVTLLVLFQLLRVILSTKNNTHKEDIKMTHILDCDLKVTSTEQAAGHRGSENTEITSVI